MVSRATALVVAAVLGLAAAAAWVGPSNTTCVQPAAGGGCMSVHRAHAGQSEAAAALLRVRELLFVAAAFLQEKYAPRGRGGVRRRPPSADLLLALVRPARLTAPSLRRLARGRLAAALAAPVPPATRAALSSLVDALLQRWDPTAISEGSPRNWEGETAYTVSHGAAMVYCLRGKQPPYPLLPDQLTFFVALHELTHIFTPGFEHPPCFWERFKWLLHEMAAAGIYTEPDFVARPQDYCGLRVNSSPTLDPGVQRIWELPPSQWASCGAH